MIDEIDPITRKSIACPAYPLCGLAITEAERVQPLINQRLYAQLREMGLEVTVGRRTQRGGTAVAGPALTPPCDRDPRAARASTS